MIRSLKKATRWLLFLPPIKRILIEVPVVYKLYPGWERTHPFDRAHKVDTSGFVSEERIHADPTLKGLVNGYGASQASIIRAALTALGDVSEHTFVDLGCGKGRATLVATEFPFRQIVGVELSSALADVARQNAEKFEAQFPSRPKITIQSQNVLDYEFPKGKLVVYMYHSFGRPVMAELLRKLEAALATAQGDHMFVIYYNPVFAEGLDTSPAFSRWFAKTIKYDRSEIGFGPDDSDTVVAWQSERWAIPSPHADRDKPILEVFPDWRAVLED